MMNNMNNANTNMNNESNNIAAFINDKLSSYFNNLDRVATNMNNESNKAPQNKNCTSVPQTYAELNVDNGAATNYIVVKYFNDDKKETTVKTYSQEEFYHRLRKSGDKIPVIKSLYQVNLITAINLAKEIVKLTKDTKEYFGHVLINKAKLDRINLKIRMMDEDTLYEYGGFMKDYVDTLAYIGDQNNCLVDSKSIKTIDTTMTKFANMCEGILRNEGIPHKYYLVCMEVEGTDMVSRLYAVPAKQVRSLLNIEGAYPEDITITDKNIKLQLQLMTSANNLMIEGDYCINQSLRGAVLRLLADYFYN